MTQEQIEEKIRQGSIVWKADLDNSFGKYYNANMKHMSIEVARFEWIKNKLAAMAAAFEFMSDALQKYQESQ